jgi:CRP-like cAMP-binding protein
MSEDRYGRLERRIKAVLDSISDRFDHLVHACGLDPTTELRFGDWHGLDLSGADLRGFDFTGANLTDSRFDDALIAGAIFDRATYDPASLCKAADFEAFNKMRERADKHALLRDHYLFGKLSPRHIDRLSPCIVTKSVKRGTNIFAKGDPGTSLCAIGAGTVRISVPSADCMDAVFNVLGKGDIFGEVLDGQPRIADATAVTDCELFVIERRDFLLLMREEPEIVLRIIEILCSKLRRTTQLAEEVMFLDLPSRLAKALMRLVDANTAAMGERKISMTEKDLGDIIGMSRESTNKQLRIWEDKKWVRLERNAVVILATDSLAAIAEDGGRSTDP